jgi:hypothetical protein
MEKREERRGGDEVYCQPRTMSINKTPWVIGVVGSKNR